MSAFLGVFWAEKQLELGVESGAAIVYNAYALNRQHCRGIFDGEQGYASRRGTSHRKTIRRHGRREILRGGNFNLTLDNIP